MRRCFAWAFLVLAAAPALAEPHVRWIDANGKYRRESIAEVLEESFDRVKVRLVDGAELTIPGPAFLGLVREREDVPEEAAFLRARQGALWGLDLDEARPVLERALARKKAPAWMREYATAGRALLAWRAQEKGALQRIESFLEAYPDSRFLQAATYARARLTLGTVDDFKQAVLHLNVPLRELGKRGAPRVEQGRFMSESVLVWRDAFPGMREMIDQMVSSASGRPKVDLYRRIGGESARQWVLLATTSRERDSVVQLNRKPVGARATMRRIVAESAYLPPGLICDARIELGWTLHLCGDRNGARKELQQAVAAAPDTVRRRRAKRYLVQLDTKSKD